MAKKETVLVRTLLDILIEGVSYRANQLVAFPVALAASLKASGQADDAKAAVEYCRSEGQEPITHAAAASDESDADEEEPPTE